MSHWNSRGLRGSALEDLINFTNEVYRKRGLALLQKIPTPITPIQVDNQAHTITLAYFEQQSTVDYIGVAQGLPLCFDAKETSVKNLPLHNIHPHQMTFMEDFLAQGGLAFLLVHFTHNDTFYFLPYDILKTYWDAAAQSGRKSIPYRAFDDAFPIYRRQNGVLDYLEGVDAYLKKQKMDQK